jgi:hypothetical protein
MSYKQKTKLEKEGWELLTIISAVDLRRNRIRIKTKRELMKEYDYMCGKYKHVRIGPSFDSYGNQHWGLKGIYIKKDYK